MKILFLLLSVLFFVLGFCVGSHVAFRKPETEGKKLQYETDLRISKFLFQMSLVFLGITVLVYVFETLTF